MMKKVIYFLLAFVMLLSFSAVVFASESSKNDGFREAGTVYVGVETRSADSANIPLGARSATTKDIAESNAYRINLLLVSLLLHLGHLGRICLVILYIIKQQVITVVPLLYRQL